MKLVMTDMLFELWFREENCTLKLLFMHVECLVGTGEQPVSVESMPCVHTTRSFSRLGVLVDILRLSMC